MDRSARTYPYQPLPEDVRTHLHAAKDELRKGMEAFLPPEFFTHRDAARREMLLAARSAIDATIAHLDERRASATPAP